jgi:hypothetical protein
MNTLLRIAVRLLPAPMRDRYREQWDADVRDATEAGLSPSSIAWGALAFAVTAPRPWPVVSFDQNRARRIAFALSLTGALLGLTWYPLVEFGSTLPAGVAMVKAVIDTVTLAVETLGPIAAVVVISAARATPTRERASVWMLAIAAAAPLVAPYLARDAMDMYANPGALAFAGAAALVIAAVILRDRGKASAPASPRAIVGGSALVLFTGGVGWAVAASMWFGRTPLVTTEPLGSVLYDIWLQLKLEFEAKVDFVLALGVFVVLGAAGTVVLTGILRGSPALKVATLTSAFLLVWGYVLMSGYFALALPSPGIAGASPLLLTALRLAVVSTIFVAVDGVRLPSRPRRTAIA